MMDTVTMIDNRTGKKAEFPILKSVLGDDVVDISSIKKELGYFTYDPGFSMTASCQSDITFIDGGKGELLYRGYPIEELAGRKNYLEVCHLLLHGHLPDPAEYVTFEQDMRTKRFPHEGIKHMFNAFPCKAHPMATLSAAVSALSTFHYQHLDMDDHDEYMEMARRIIAKMPTIAAWTYRHSKGYPYLYPDMDRYYTENFLYMLRAFPGGKVNISQVEVDALDAIFTLHADHEQNASTSTVRMVASTGAHPYAAISAGINALWGRAHGGANESVIAQLEMIGSPDKVDDFIKRVKDPDDPFKLMGFGHRVYKNFDPRAKILRQMRDNLRDKLDLDSELIATANRVEEIALNDDYFVSRNLYPNVDFYSGTILSALGIPKAMFTPIFVLGRTIGWITQWNEHRRDPKMRISRPRQRYVGPDRRHIPEA